MTTRRQKVHGVEVTASAATGAVGSVFGAAKLRDSYKESYPERFTRRVDRIPSVLRAAGVSQQGAARAARIVSRGKPGFVPLATAVTAGSVATGARRYGARLDRKHPVAKSDTGNGYRRAIDMTGAEHIAARVRRDWARQENIRGAAKRARPEDPLAQVWQQHGVRPGISAAVRSPTRASKVHPNVHYGSSVSPAFERRLDRNLHPSATAKLRHPVVFHRGATAPTALAAAAGAHTTTGGRGHVIFNRDVTSIDGKLRHNLPSSFRAIVHHEMAHAASRVSNPARLRTATSIIGEEARADAVGVPGRGLYRHNGVVPGRLRAKGMAALGQHFAAQGSPMSELGHGAHYHHVHASARSALGNPPGLAREVAHSLARRGAANPRAVVLSGAAVGAGVLHHRKEKLVSKSAFGVDHGAVAKAARFAGPGRLVSLDPERHPLAPRSPVRSRIWVAQADRRAGEAKRGGERLATGVRVAKSDVRMSPDPARPWDGYLPRHTPGAIAANKSAFTASIEAPGRLRPVKPGMRVARPLITRVAKSAPFDPEGNRHRRAGVETGLLAAGSGGAGLAALRSGRTVRTHLGAARAQDVAAAGHFADADGALADVRTRVTGHARRSGGGKAAATGLPNTPGSFKHTLGSADRASQHLAAGHAARRGQHASLQAAKVATRRGGAFSLTAVGLGAAAAAVQADRKRGGRSYGYR